MDAIRHRYLSEYSDADLRRRLSDLWASGKRGSPHEMLPAVFALVDEAEEEALAKWEKHCSEERKRIKVHYKALRGSQKKSGNDPDRHIRWLVRRQILGETFKEIERSERANVDLETIRKGVMSATEKTGPFNSEQPELEVWDNDTTDVHYIVD